MPSLRLVLVSTLVACGSSEPGTPADQGPPTLSVDSPTRGTTVDGSTVNVTGHVTGGTGAVQVTVSGSVATVGSDGAFAAQVPVNAGISVIETHAIDSLQHDVRDVRAVLAGTLAASDGTIAAPIATHASRNALNKV